MDTATLEIIQMAKKEMLTMATVINKVKAAAQEVERVFMNLINTTKKLDQVQQLLTKSALRLNTALTKLRDSAVDFFNRIATLNGIPLGNNQSQATVNDTQNIQSTQKNVGQVLLGQMPIAQSMVDMTQLLGLTGPVGAVAGAFAGLLLNSKAFNDIIEVINLYLEDLADAIGEIIRPLMSLVNVIFKTLNPIIKALAKVLAAVLKPVIQALFPILKALGVTLLWLSEVFFKSVGILYKSFGGLVKIIGGIGQALLSMLKPIINPLMVVFQILASSIIELTNIILKVGELLVNITGALVKTIGGMISGLGDALGGIEVLGKKPFGSLASSLKEAGNGINGFGKGIMDGANKIGDTVIQLAKVEGDITNLDYSDLEAGFAIGVDAVSGFADNIGEGSEKISDDLKKSRDELSNLNFEEATKALPKLAKAFNDLAAKVKDSFSSNLTQGDNPLISFAKGAKSYFDDLKKRLAEVFNTKYLDKLNQKFKETFANLALKFKASDPKKIANPTEYAVNLVNDSNLDNLFEEMKNLSNLENGMNQVIKTIKDKAKAAGIDDTIIDHFLPPSKAEKRAQEIGQTIKDGFVNSFMNGQGIIEAIFEGVKGQVNKVFGDMASSIYDSLTGGKDGLATKLVNLFDNLEQKLKGFDFKNSNLTGFLKGELDNGEIKSIVAEINTFKDKAQNLESIQQLIKEKLIKAGADPEIIKSWFPLTEAEKKAQEIADKVKQALSTGVSAALESGNIQDINLALGDQLLQDLKSNLMTEFISKNKEKYQEEFKKNNSTQTQLTGDPKQDFELMQQAIKDYTKQLQDNNLIAKDISQTARETGNNYEKLNQKIFDITSNLAQSLSKLGDFLGNDLLKDIADILEQAIDKGKEFEKKFTPEKISKSINKAVGFLDGIGEKFGGKDGFLNGLISKGANGLSGMLGKAGGMLSSVAGMAGPIGMIVGGLSAWGSSIDKKAEARKQKQDAIYQKQLEVANKQLEQLKLTSKYTNDTAKNIIKAISVNPTTTNIAKGKEVFNELISLFQSGKGFKFSKLSMEIGETDRKRLGTKKVTDWHNRIQDPMKFVHGYLKDNWGNQQHTGSLISAKFSKIESTKDISSLIDLDAREPLKELKEFNKEIQNLNKADFKKLAKSFDRSDFKDFKFDLGPFKEQLNEYVTMMDKLFTYSKDMPKISRLESFEGIEWLSRQEKLEQYKQQLTQMYDDSGLKASEYKEEIDELAEKMVEAGGSMVTIMSKVRQGFISTFANGGSMIASFASGMKGYFDTMAQNFASVVYNIKFDKLNKGFETIFGGIMENLAGYEGNNPLEYANSLLGGTFKGKDANGDPASYTLDGMLEEMKKLEADNTTMDTFWDNVRERAKEAGIGQEIIDTMLPATEASKKAQEIANSVKNSLSNAMSAALDSGSVLDFTASMGESIYNNAKEALINAFMESKVYQDMFSKWFETDSIEFTGNIDTDLENMTSLLDDFESELNKAGLGFNYSDVASESDSESGTSSSEFYGGASVSGETTQIINNNYYYQPKDNNFFDGNKQSLYREFLEWKEKIKAKE
jgi:hypothetical protein